MKDFIAGLQPGELQAASPEQLCRPLTTMARNNLLDKTRRQQTNGSVEELLEQADLLAAIYGQLTPQER